MKKQHKTKKEIVAEMEKTKKVKEMRDKIKNKLYPLLLKETETVDEAKMVCQMFAIDLRQVFNNKAKEFNVGNVGLKEYIKNSKDTSAKRYRKIIEIFKDMPVMEGATLVESFSQEIDRWIRMEKRSLKDLKNDFYEN